MSDVVLSRMSIELVPRKLTRSPEPSGTVERSAPVLLVLHDADGVWHLLPTIPDGEPLHEHAFGLPDQVPTVHGLQLDGLLGAEEQQAGLEAEQPAQGPACSLNASGSAE